MMGSAQVDILPEEQADAVRQPGLRAEAAERLAAHRLRRAKHGATLAEPAQEASGGRRGEVAAAVAERFAQTPSYRAMLAEQARQAMEHAAAAAEIALRNAEAVHAAQSELLVELQKWTEPVKFTARTAEVVGTDRVTADQEPAVGQVASAAAPTEAKTSTGLPVRELSTAGLTVRLYEDVGPVAVSVAGRRNKDVGAIADEQESRELDAEIAFRQAPVFEPYHAPEPAVPIPGNLLEFPRLLVAQKKNRPRLAEGPLLLEEAERNPQLRIFEVEPKPLEAESAPSAMEWSSIWLDAHTVTEVIENPDASPTALLASLLPPQVAPMHLRAMATAVDGLLVLGGFVLFAAAAAYVAGAVPVGTVAGIAAAGALALLYLSYQALFFWLNDSTPGMRYARIGLCTFSDENPSRSAMRKRILAQLVAVCPLGLGVLWMLLDDDHLGWHDRISRMYQRAY